MAYYYLLLASIFMYAAAGNVISLGQSKTSSFFLVGAVSFALGAYTAAVLISNDVTELSIIFLVSAIVAGGFGAVISALTSFHDSRVMDIIAIALVLALGAIVRSWYNPDFPAGSFPSLTNGTFGFSSGADLSLLGFAFPRGRLDGLIASALLLVLIYLAVRAIERSKFGLFLAAIDDNRLQSALDGYRITTLHAAFGALGGALISLAGVCYFVTYRFVDPSIWTLEIAIGVCLIPMVLPFGSHWLRAMLGATIFVMLPELLRAVNIGAPLETYVRNVLFLTLALVAGIPRLFSASSKVPIVDRKHFV